MPGHLIQYGELGKGFIDRNCAGATNAASPLVSRPGWWGVGLRFLSLLLSIPRNIIYFPQKKNCYFLIKHLLLKHPHFANISYCNTPLNSQYLLLLQAPKAPRVFVITTSSQNTHHLLSGDKASGKMLASEVKVISKVSSGGGDSARVKWVRGCLLKTIISHM